MGAKPRLSQALVSRPGGPVVVFSGVREVFRVAVVEAAKVVAKLVGERVVIGVCVHAGCPEWITFSPTMRAAMVSGWRLARMLTIMTVLHPLGMSASVMVISWVCIGFEFVNKKPPKGEPWRLLATIWQC